MHLFWQGKMVKRLNWIDLEFWKSAGIGIIKNRQDKGWQKHVYRRKIHI